MTEENYAGVADRVKAAVTDGIVIFAFMLSITYAFAQFKHVHDNAKIIAFAFIFLLYDPIFTSVFGGTIGHMVLGIRIKREKNKMKNILFPLAIVRYILKALLGWISLLTVMGSEKRQAIHDAVVGSVAIYKGKTEETTYGNMEEES